MSKEQEYSNEILLIYFLHKHVKGYHVDISLAGNLFYLTV